MPTYASFLKPNVEAYKEIRKSRERFEMGRKAVESAGGKVLGAYYVISRGEYLIITEFPDELARVKSILGTLQHGHVQYEVLSVLPIEEYLKLTDQS